MGVDSIHRTLDEHMEDSACPVPKSTALLDLTSHITPDDGSATINSSNQSDDLLDETGSDSVTAKLNLRPDWRFMELFMSRHYLTRPPCPSLQLGRIRVVIQALLVFHRHNHQTCPFRLCLHRAAAYKALSRHFAWMVYQSPRDRNNL